jgi:hypothetical protein
MEKHTSATDIGRPVLLHLHNQDIAMVNGEKNIVLGFLFIFGCHLWSQNKMEKQTLANSRMFRLRQDIRNNRDFTEATVYKGN